MRALSIAATGMLAQQTNVEVISNNIANVNTTGHKRQRAEFQDLLYQDLRRVGATSSDAGTIIPTGVQIGIGVKVSGVYRIVSQGDLVSTENQLDMAIEGKGLFRITLPDGQDAYTRAGSFQRSATGEIVTHDGLTVQPAITIPPEAIDVVINQTGEVQIKVSGQTELNNIGQFELATFANEAGLEAIGDNLLLETPASGTATLGSPGATGFGSIRQGFLETANINAVSEITALITAQRAYELNSKVISAADEMMRTVTTLR